jgi:hypothetical protein
MKKAYLNERAICELKRCSKVDTNTYRYLLFRSLSGEALVKRIRREYLCTIASSYDATDENPNGWEQVEIRVRG